MQTATVKQLKDELKTKTPEKLLEYCLHLSKFKKENKELLTYLLFEAQNEEHYIRDIKSEMDDAFRSLNLDRYYYMKKGVRKILRTIKKYIRYSKNKETEVELLLYFCMRMKLLRPSIQFNLTLQNIFNRQIEYIQRRIPALHEDLQYDFTLEIEELLSM